MNTIQSLLTKIILIPLLMLVLTKTTFAQIQLNPSHSVINNNVLQTLGSNLVSDNRIITMFRLLNQCGKIILAIISMVMIPLIFSIIYIIYIKRKHEQENKRYRLLSWVSNEYLYEYDIKTEELELSSEWNRLFKSREKLHTANQLVKDKIICKELGECIDTITIPLSENDIRTFKTVNICLYDNKGQTYAIIGKLVDISVETAEKQKLINKSQTDGLTNIYNKITTQNLIDESIKNFNNGTMDALIIIDLDNFKEINDTYGHLEGDKVLKDIGNILKVTFRQSDIIGRIGGDEFAVYVKNISSPDFLYTKYQQIKSYLERMNPNFPVSISMGIALLEDFDTYIGLFNKADTALYQAKKNNGNHIVIYNKEMKSIKNPSKLV